LDSTGKQNTDATLGGGTLRQQELRDALKKSPAPRDVAGLGRLSERHPVADQGKSEEEA
jgi:hypothetical protein